MARKKKEVREPLLRQETLDSIVAILAFVGALVLSLAWFGRAGKLGYWIVTAFGFLLGKGYFLLPLALVFVGASLLFSVRQKVVSLPLIGALIFVVFSLSLSDIFFGGEAGGFVGELVARPFIYLFDTVAATIILFAGILISVLVIFNASIRRSWEKFREDRGNAEEHKAAPVINGAAASVPDVVKDGNDKKYDVAEEDEKPAERSAGRASPNILKALNKKAEDFKLPPLSLLEDDKGKPSAGDIKANANIIQRTLYEFGIPVEMSEVNVGPSVTQYTLKPAQGIKLSRITNLHNDLALALAAHPIRIEAPIPGRSFVGIEIPNKSVALVGLRSLFAGKEFQNGGPLAFPLGKCVTGLPIYDDLARMPHLLIAGSTGSGKSVGIHSLLMSLLFKNTPLSLRLLLIDPKRVELVQYRDLPHLLTPVITDAKETVSALRWATKEMESRYKTLEEARKRDIVSYNASASEFMPYIVIVIDELADLMASFGREVEASIVRIAQMARAVGIHLVVSTQRPSVEVVTGLIKANILSRIAFQVASQVDSRTIIDTAGAEKLLGNGDMLFLPGDVAKPIRVQGGFVSDKEVKNVTKFIRNQDVEPEYNEDIALAKDKASLSFGDDGADDELFDMAYKVVVEAGKASTSYLQRRLKVGYARAARLMDMLEENGVVSQSDGAKPREILVAPEEPNSENDIHVS